MSSPAKTTTGERTTKLTWASALLAAGTVSTIAISVLSQVNERLFAIPTGVALVGLG